MTDYDVIVVGCGPAGLMACGELARRGIRVLGIDKKPRIGQNIRSASGFFFTETNFNSEYIRPEPLADRTMLHYSKNGFTVEYSAAMEGIYHSHMFTDTGRHWQASTRKKPFYSTFNPTRWQSDRFIQAQKNGAQFMPNTLAVRVSQNDRGVELTVRIDGNDRKLTCRKLIASDGLASRIAKKTGMNDGRIFYGVGPTLEYEVTGVDCPYDRGDMIFFGAKNFGGLPGTLIMVPSLSGKDAFRMETISSLPASIGTDMIEYFIHKSPFAHWFKNISIIERSGALVELRTPMMIPYTGNILFVGDSAAFAECLYQCATMAGYMGALCTERELAGNNGFEEYTRWWAEHFEWIKNPKRMADYGKRIFFPRFFTVRELDFLFDLNTKNPVVVDQADATPYDFAAMVFQQYMSMPEVPQYLKQRMQEIIDADQARIATVIGKVQQA